MAQDKKFKVGVSLPESQNPFYVAMSKSIVKTFEANGIEATLLLANSDVNEQVSQINDLIASKGRCDPRFAGEHRRPRARAEEGA